MREDQRQACQDAARASNYWRLLGIELVDLADGFARLRLPVASGLHQGYGVAHGGAITSLADSALAIALMTQIEPGQRVFTIELKVNFLMSIESGEMIAEARVVHKGRRIAVGEVDIKDNEGRMVAKMLSTYSIGR
jgi:uncharacterized protein (TIGR00369 family)